MLPLLFMNIQFPSDNYIAIYKYILSILREIYESCGEDEILFQFWIVPNFHSLNFTTKSVL